jgi:hypothetical protein
MSQGERGSGFLRGGWVGNIKGKENKIQAAKEGPIPVSQLINK